jgi:uncharacterized protein YndB with AHSA1/START domain
MADNTRRFAAPCDDVWAILADGDTYSQWVVGPSAVRAVDDDWPAPGARLHYRIGRPPFSYDGHTEVLSVDTGRRLELEAHAWPAGTARIELRLDADGKGCLVHMTEHPARGSAAVLHNRVGDALLRLRNVESLRRLERLVRRRAGAQR